MLFVLKGKSILTCGSRYNVGVVVERERSRKKIIDLNPLLIKIKN